MKSPFHIGKNYKRFSTVRVRISNSRIGALHLCSSRSSQPRICRCAVWAKVLSDKKSSSYELRVGSSTVFCLEIDEEWRVFCVVVTSAYPSRHVFSGTSDSCKCPAAVLVASTNRLLVQTQSCEVCMLWGLAHSHKEGILKCRFSSTRAAVLCTSLVVQRTRWLAGKPVAFFPPAMCTVSHCTCQRMLRFPPLLRLQVRRPGCP